MVGGQLRPPVVHRVEQVTPGFARPLLIDEIGEPRRQVRVLHRDRRHVAAREILDESTALGVDPSRARSCDYREGSPVESSGPGEVVDGEPCALFRGGSRLQTRVGADGRQGRGAHERGNIPGGRAGTEKFRPCRPSDCHGTSDSGLPERCGPAGRTTPSWVVPFCTEKASSAAATSPSSRTPLTSSAVPTATDAQPTARAARAPNHRPSSSANHR